jgi:hypothetical protein
MKFVYWVERAIGSMDANEDGLLDLWIGVWILESFES